MVTHGAGADAFGGPGTRWTVFVEGETPWPMPKTIVSGMAGRYASALFALAKDSRSIDKVAADLKSFDALVQDNPDLQLLVRSPVFTAEDQSRALKAVLERAGISGLTANFLLSRRVEAPPFRGPHDDPRFSCPR